MTQSFSKISTTDDVLANRDLTGKTVLVTGVSAGIGVETARVLAAHGARVIGTARDLVKADIALQDARAAAAPGGSITVVQADLASLASIRACTDALNGESFDVLIANAGVMACPQGTTVDGFETQFGTNHLGHFTLINRLASQIKPQGRVVILSSAGHRYGDVDLVDPNFLTTPYEPFLAYGRSKTANALFALEFDARHKDQGIRAFSVHPGRIQTELSRYLTPETLAALIANINAAQPAGTTAMEYKSIPQGAATSVWAAFVADDADGGKYCEDCHIAEVMPTSSLIMYGAQPHIRNQATAKALWRLSEQMIGETF